MKQLLLISLLLLSFGVCCTDLYALDHPPRRTPFDAAAMPDAWLDANGGLVIQQGGEQYRIQSIFSYPNGGYNLFGPGPSPEAEESAFASSRQVTQVDSITWQVQAEGSYYSINRLVKLCCGKIRIKDTITNKGSSTIGVIVKNYLRYDGRTFSNIRMAGLPNVSIADPYYIRSNPTVFVPLDDGWLGLLVEDDVFRLQASLFNYSSLQGIGAKTEYLAITGNESHTLCWSVYIFEDPDGYSDYFDFVNFVRRDWDSNFLITGPYMMCDPNYILDLTDAELRDGIEGNNVYGVVLTSSFIYQGNWWGWFVEFYWGQPTDVFYAYIAKMNNAIAKLRRVAPDVKILHKYHSLLNVLDNINNFPDSQVRNWDGSLVIYPGYRELVFPTLTNSYGQGMFNMLELIMTTHDVDGIYWDEFTGAGYAENMLIPFATFNRFDNHTAVISSTNKLIWMEAAIINFISDSWTKEAIDRVHSYGGELLANSPPGLSDYNAMRFPRFIETQSNAANTYGTNLYSPLCYISQSPAKMAKSPQST